MVWQTDLHFFLSPVAVHVGSSQWGTSLLKVVRAVRLLSLALSSPGACGPFVSHIKRGKDVEEHMWDFITPGGKQYFAFVLDKPDWFTRDFSSDGLMPLWNEVSQHNTLSVSRAHGSPMQGKPSLGRHLCSSCEYTVSTQILIFTFFYFSWDL